MMEVERKFLVTAFPELEEYRYHDIEQGYISRSPVIRIRRRDDDYILTVKGSGLMSRQEFELPLTREQYEELSRKVEGIVIKKRRYLIPFEGYTIELDVFAEPLAPLVYAEVEFPDEAAAKAFTPPRWFGEDVTSDPNATNAALSRRIQ